jgi:hypothetical protein
MIELETHHRGGTLEQDLELVRRRRMDGLAGGTTVAALRSRRPGRLARSGIVRGDIRRSFGTSHGVARGVPLAVRLRVVSAGSGRPLPGFAVYLWHSDADGAYSLRDAGLEGENYLRGVQVADPAGWVRFASVVPGVPRLHYEILAGLDESAVGRGELTLDGLTGDARRGMVATLVVAV